MVRCTINMRNPRFKIGHVDTETSSCSPFVCKSIETLSGILSGLEYEGSIGIKNSSQLDIHLEDSFASALLDNKWIVIPSPALNNDKLAIDWGNLKADLLIHHSNDPEHRIVVEIEKANKKTLWIDFIKLCAFLEVDDIQAGILICPHNYAHSTGVWNLYTEACRCKRALAFAGVPANKLGLIGIVGYKQLIERGGQFRHLDKSELKGLKARTEN